MLQISDTASSLLRDVLKQNEGKYLRIVLDGAG